MITFILVAGALTPGYSQINETVSKLAEQGAEHPEVMITGFILYGALVIGFANALFLNLRHGFRAHVAWIFMMLYGVCMILAGIFQDIPGGEEVPLNTEGLLHNAVIIISCIAFLIGMWAFAGCVYRRPHWMGFTWFTVAASLIGLILSIVFAVQSSIPVPGLLQRIFYCVLLGWIEVVSIWLFRLTFKKDSKHGYPLETPECSQD